MFASGEQVLGKDMEERERQSVKLIAQLQSVTEKYNTTERQRDSLETTVDDVSRLVMSSLMRKSQLLCQIIAMTSLS